MFHGITDIYVESDGEENILEPEEDDKPQDQEEYLKLNQGNDCSTKSLPPSGRPPTKIAQHSEFRFLNRAISIFPEESFTLKPGCKRYVKIVAPFPEQLSGVAIVKIVQGVKTITLQLTLQKNLGNLGHGKYHK